MIPPMQHLNRNARLSLLALRQGGDYTRNRSLGRRPLDWREFRIGLWGIAIIIVAAYVALAVVGILQEAGVIP